MLGRQGLLSEFTWNAEGWPEFVNKSPQAAPLTDVRLMNVTDNFEGEALDLSWQWPVGNIPRLEVADNQLHLGASPARLGAIVAQRTYAATYTTSVILDATRLSDGTFAGLGAVGDPYNALALVAGDNMLQLWHVKMGKKQRLAHVLLEPGTSLGLRLECWGGRAC